MPRDPRTTKDLMLAPVAAEIDNSVAERSARVLARALRNVELHDWRAEITDDAARLRLSGGSVSLDIGLSGSLMSYISASAETR